MSAVSEDLRALARLVLAGLRALAAEDREAVVGVLADLEAWLAPPAQPAAPPFLWPTPHQVVTQAFGAAPAYYGKFGLPGHEGIDLRALHGDPICAVMDGVVARVDHAHRAYGYSLRQRVVLAGVEYEVLYAHGVTGSAAVQPGDEVERGERLMAADATGNVVAGASHLHLSLKRPGRPWRDAGGRVWPSDLVDPTPFLVTPGFMGYD